MDHQDFKIGIITVWFLVIGNLLLTTCGVLAKLQDWNYSQVLLTIGLMLFFSTWIIILSDMVKREISNKSFWIFTMFLMPNIVPILYMFRRKKLLKVR